ncbi:MAG: hypothetical protein EOP87_08360 [Verrucomicrobiaceae bacterium]|nr:MAG: hypothetical protein EOP87_08360 [Verrucomicrobiaceae bacterium]
MPSPQDTYALILAGGSGTRFWPLSRNNKPKQLLDLFNSGTLLAQTIARLEGLVPTENIIILTNALQAEGVREAAPQLPAGNIISEPAKRDTAPAVALGIGLIAARNPEAVMMVLPADQLIQDVEAYQAVMRDALATAEKADGLVTIGLRPTWACPSYGYIERGERASIVGLICENSPFEVKRFREKPNPELAEQFLAAGGFSWNAGMFVWSLPTVINQLVKQLSSMQNEMMVLSANFPQNNPKSFISILFIDNMFNNPKMEIGKIKSAYETVSPRKNGPSCFFNSSAVSLSAPSDFFQLSSAPASASLWTSASGLPKSSSRVL